MLYQKKRGSSIPFSRSFISFVEFLFDFFVYVSATVSFDFAWAALTIPFTIFVSVLHVE